MTLLPSPRSEIPLAEARALNMRFEVAPMPVTVSALERLKRQLVQDDPNREPAAEGMVAVWGEFLAAPFWEGHSYTDS